MFDHTFKLDQCPTPQNAFVALEKENHKDVNEHEQNGHLLIQGHAVGQFVNAVAADIGE